MEGLIGRLVEELVVPDDEGVNGVINAPDRNHGVGGLFGQGLNCFVPDVGDHAIARTELIVHVGGHIDAGDLVFGVM